MSDSCTTNARIALFPWITSGDLQVAWSLRIDTLTAVMLVVVNTNRRRASVFDRPYGRGPVPAAVLQLSVRFSPSAMLMLVTAIICADVFRLGGRGAGELSVDRILVPTRPSANAPAIKASSSTGSAISDFCSAFSRDLMLIGSIDLETSSRAAGPDWQDHRLSSAGTPTR